MNKYLRKPFHLIYYIIIIYTKSSFCYNRTYDERRSRRGDAGASITSSSNGQDKTTANRKHNSKPIDNMLFEISRLFNNGSKLNLSTDSSLNIYKTIRVKHQETSTNASPQIAFSIDMENSKDEKSINNADSISAVYHRKFDKVDQEKNEYFWYGVSNDGLLQMSILIKKDQQSSNYYKISGSVNIRRDTHYSFYTTDHRDGNKLRVHKIASRSLPIEMHVETNHDDDNVDDFISEPFVSTNIIENETVVMMHKMKKQVNKIYDGTTKKNDKTEIDIICLYTRQALCNEVGEGDYCDVIKFRYVMDDKCQLAVHETNLAFHNSKVDAEIRIVYSGLIDINYDEEGDACTTTQRMAYSQMDVYTKIRELRNYYGADLVGLMMNDSSYCGCGFKYKNGDDNRGFFSVHRGCATGYYSFAHEIGHNMGCSHQVTNSNQSISNQSEDDSAHGYIDSENEFRTIMSTSCSDGKNCPRIPMFSSNDSSITCKDGRPCGSIYEDNASQIRNVQLRVSLFRESVTSEVISSLWTPFTSTQSCQDGYTSLILYSDAGTMTTTSTSNVTWKLWNKQNKRKNIFGNSFSSKNFTKKNSTMEKNQKVNIFVKCIPTGSCYSLTASSSSSLPNNTQLENHIVIMNGKRITSTTTTTTKSSSVSKVGGMLVKYNFGIDSTMKKFYAAKGLRNCSWLNSSPTKRKKFCSRNKMARLVCPESCQSCWNNGF